MNLCNIKTPADIKKLSMQQLNELSDELRAVLLQKLAHHGGHVGPNLGMVEATVAMHYVFNAPEDKLVFDVSHQSYVHKMLTGRIDAFINPKLYDSVTGYTNWEESEYDLFTVGHTSTAVSLAAGLAKGRDLQGESYRVVALVGDGSLSGGEAFEGLDLGATLDSNFIVIVNDNDMSIAENHGGLYNNLRELRESNGTCPVNYFKALDYEYMYVNYGNDIRSLIDAFEQVKDTRRPVVVHINTMKGHGYVPAERNKEAFHFSAPFDKATGQLVQLNDSQDYSDIFRDYMLGRMASDSKITVITAGTPGVLGFDPEARALAGKQFVDVGIAEQTAVALASGIAKSGVRPVFGVVSSFLQRAYDQLSQDVAINGTAPVVNIFYGGAWGMNDVTHLGWFDIALVSNIPGWIYLAPTCKEEYLAMLEWAVNQHEHAVAIRVPGPTVISTGEKVASDFSHINKFEMVHKGKGVALIGAGNFLQRAKSAAAILKEKGVDATIINPRFLSGVDEKMLDSLLADHKLVITLEDGVIDGGFGQKVATFYGPTAMRVKCLGLKKEFADHYDRQALLHSCGLDPQLIADTAISLL
ncbi:MAG: 1-deoxy-D-xylulose-5-phosphate synthase [Prevotella sp.]|nr:1-deoxy-D-xylulose-5-phosphate synthase [Prevotella sp.]MCM1074056.1 1-deoxy-D-xylulose-5-phosphate synthase [Ruminococcus sp.]